MSTEAGREEKREEKAKRKRKKGKMRKKVGGHVNGKQNHVFIDCQGLHCQWFQIPFIGGSKIPPGFLGAQMGVYWVGLSGSIASNQHHTLTGFAC